MTIRRIFMATINADHPQQGMIHAFESLFGRENVRHYDYMARQREGRSLEYINEEMLQDAKAIQPDWMWLQLQNSNVISAETVSNMEKALPSCVITHWCGDVREKVSDYFASICKATHLTLVANKGFIPAYLEAGARKVQYLAHGLDWREDVLGLPEWEPTFRVPPIVYCGNHYGKNMVGSDIREAAVRAVFDAGFDIGVVGCGWEETGLPVVGECKVKQQVQVYREAMIVLSVNHFPDLQGYHGDRTITAMASGTPVIQRYFPEIELEFRDKEHLLVFKDEKELVEKVEWLLDNRAMARELGFRGRAEVIKSHTWFSRILESLPTVEDIQASLMLGRLRAF